MNQQISGVVITKNEEANIKDCILSLQQVADEVIVLDSFSTDRTPDICRELGVRFEQHAFDGMIEQKRRVIEMASCSHILLLDADERLSPELADYILKQKATSSLNEVYEFNRLNNYCGKWIHHCGWYPDRKIRLWKKGSIEVTGTNPHDYIRQIGGRTVTRVSKDIQHYTYRTIDEHELQIQKFSTIAALQAYKKGKRTSLMATYIKPAFKFFRDYIIKSGFKDGYYGWLVCRMGAHAKRMKYLKLYHLQKKEDPS